MVKAFLITKKMINKRNISKYRMTNYFNFLVYMNLNIVIKSHFYLRIVSDRYQTFNLIFVINLYFLNKWLIVF